MRADLMTVGELARRTGISAKAIRELEGLGLVYTAGRSEASYRLVDESAIWCVQTIDHLRGLGLTIKEIRQLAAIYLDRPQEPIGPRLAELLDQAETRIAQRREQLDAIQHRIRDFRAANSAALAGRTESDLATTDPRRLTFPPGSSPTLPTECRREENDANEGPENRPDRNDDLVRRRTWPRSLARRSDRVWPRGAPLRERSRALHRLGRHDRQLRPIAALAVNPYTAGGAALFYGATLLVAALRAQPGCEATVISNSLLGRDDQIGCPVFSPIDHAEAHLAAQATRSRQTETPVSSIDRASPTPSRRPDLPRG